MVVHASTSSYQVDPNWYVDTGTTDHITGELKKLAVGNKYQGGDQIHMASGTSMDTSHIGHTTFDTPNHPILLKNILYVPRTRKNLVSIQCLTPDNSIYVEFYPFFFLIKDQKTRTTLLKGRCMGGMYPLPLDEIKQVCNTARSQINAWYSQLGHASRKVVEKILRNNNLLSSQESVSHFVCDAC
jgi:hypothetical protein